jgi:hypothetical protein
MQMCTGEARKTDITKAKTPSKILNCEFFYFASQLLKSTSINDKVLNPGEPKAVQKKSYIS